MPFRPEPDFVPSGSITPVPPWWKRPKYIAMTTVLVMVIGVAVYFVTRSDNLCATNTPGLHWVGPDSDRECVGVMETAAYPFDDQLDAKGRPDHQLTSIVAKIAKENRRVAALWDGPDHVPYVKVALLTPMQGDDSTALPIDQIRASLEGAYTAQCRANECPGLPNNQRVDIAGSHRPNFQLVLASEGRNETHWNKVVDQLAGMTGGDHPLVAVTGLGISVKATRDAAQALSDRHIPTIGGVISATDMKAASFYKISPSNEDSAKALKAEFSLLAQKRPELEKGYLVFDSKNDNFSRTLAEGMESQFRKQIDGRRVSFIGKTIATDDGTEQDFRAAVTNVCGTHAKSIFYAGRSRDLPALARALAGRVCASDGPIIVFTCSTGLWGAGQDKKFPDYLSAHGITIVDASATDSASWIRNTVGTPAGFKPFHQAYLSLKFDPDELVTGYAILNHDAFLTAVYATRFALDSAPGGSAQPKPARQGTQALVPSTADVAARIPNLTDFYAVDAASGHFSFTDPHIRDGCPIHKPVPITVVPKDSVPHPTLYTTR